MPHGPPSGGGGSRSGRGGSKAAPGGRSDVQDRLRELRSRQDAWMQQRERSLGSEPAAADEEEPRKPLRPQPQQQKPRTSAPASSASTAAGAAPGLLERVRLELDDIEREVRASAGLPTPPSAAGTLAPAAAAAARATASVASGLRPMSHYCPACGRLMLGVELAPQLLTPCGHSVCAECAPRPAESLPPLRCPNCGLRVAGMRPDAALRTAVGAFAQDARAPAGGAVVTSAAANATNAGRWLQQLDVISGRMRHLDASMEALQAEAAQLTDQLEAEVARDRQLAGSEAAARKEIERLQMELRSLGEQRSVSRENQAFIQSEIDAKKQAIQGAFASQQLVSQELAKLQRLCDN